MEGRDATPAALTVDEPAVLVALVVAMRLYRDGIAEILGGVEGFRVAAARASWHEALPAILESQPDIVLLDMSLADSVGALAELRRIEPEPKVVVLGLTETEVDVLSWVEAGAVGYVTREQSAEEFVQTVRRVARGEMQCSPQITATLLRRVRALGAKPQQAALTARESEIGVLIAQGLSNKEIARRLSIELATVKNHVHNILQKLGVAGRGQAAALLREPRI